MSEIFGSKTINKYKMEAIERIEKIKRNKQVAKMLISEYFNINIAKKTNERKYTEARSIFYKILRDNTRMTFAEIAETFGKDHATVLVAVNKINDLMKYDISLRSDYNYLNNAFIQKIEEDLLYKYTSATEIIEDSRYIELVGDFNNLSRKYRLLKEAHNDVVVSSASIIEKYKFLRKNYEERERFYQKNGYVVNGYITN